MPELPDIDVYVEVLQSKLGGRVLEDIRLGNPFLLRSVEPPLSDARGRRVTTLRRVGKRVAIGLDNGLWLVIHLMIAGRLELHASRPPLTRKNRLAAFDFAETSLLLTEAGSKKRASLHVARGEDGLAVHDPGGLEPLDCSFPEFVAAIHAGNNTLKRALTDPRRFSGIGNAYSDEILHLARLSPVLLTGRLGDDEARRLFEAMRATLCGWRERLLEESGGEMPRRVTAFRDDMRVHGRFGKPCPVCAAPVQRIRYKSNETNYCARCQTGSKILKDRSLSRLLKDDWPATLQDQ